MAFVSRGEVPLPARQNEPNVTAAPRVPIPGTHRTTWPGSSFAQKLTSGADVSLTAWFRPQRGNDIDPARVHALAATAPCERSYRDRKSLALETDADPADRERFAAYCRDAGLAVTESHWRSAGVTGPLDRLVEAFGATAAVFLDVNGNRFRHRSGSLHVPAEIALFSRGVFGLHQWPRSRKLGALQRHATPLTASQVAARYAFPDADGCGQTIGIVQFRGEFRSGDFDQCMRAQGISAAHPVVKRVDDAAVQHEIETTKDLEAALDAQVIATLAPGARVVVYEAPDDERGYLDAVRTAIFDDEEKPSVLSISYGWPEMLWTPAAIDLLDELFQAAALAGVSVFCSSGDNGAELDYDGKPHVLAPASSPHVYGCGATCISTGAAGETETAWAKSGGGFSEHFSAPPWQSAGARAVPDVAAQQEPGYCVYLNGTELAMGGTSAVAPVWAALTARLNQRAGCAAGLSLPLLYAAREDAFRAVTPPVGLGVPVGTVVETALTAPRGASP
jgi:kumamolisin